MNLGVVQILVGTVLSSIVFGFLAYLWVVACERFAARRGWGQRRVWAMATLLPPALLLGVVPVVMGALSAQMSYAGKCRGFTDGVSDCTYTQFLTQQIFYAEMIALYPAGMVTLFSFVFLAWKYFRRRRGI